MDIDIFVEPTPNPNALKFVLNLQVKTSGKTSFRTYQEAEELPMIAELFKIRGVDQVHLFDNVITITKFPYEDWGPLEQKVESTIKEEIENHNPDFIEKDPEEERRKNLSPELQEIESIMDRTIRPGLQADGGDLMCMDYRDNVLIIQYQGACGNCPSSQHGTLNAIKGILQAEYNPEIEVYAAPSY